MKTRTSQEWHKLYLEISPIYTKIIDPDGWDRKNFTYSFYEEKITIEEWERRLMLSTCVYSKKCNKI